MTSLDNHVRDLTKVVECLGKAGLKIKHKKCEFGCNRVWKGGCASVGLTLWLEFRKPITKNNSGHLLVVVDTIGYS